MALPGIGQPNALFTMRGKACVAEPSRPNIRTLTSVKSTSLIHSLKAGCEVQINQEDPASGRVASALS